MKFDEIVVPTMKELFIKDIERKILSGELKPYDKLPSERELEASMKVSKTVINSGFTELAKNGFVKIVPRKGVFVDDYIRNGKLNTLISIINFNGGKIDKKTYDSLTEYRIFFDTECCALAAKRHTKEDIATLRDIYAAMSKSTDEDEILELKFKFLHAIYFATGNNIYPLLCNSFKNVCHTFNKIVMKYNNYDISMMKLPELITAIENMDSETARKIMHDYLSVQISKVREIYFSSEYTP